MDEANDTMNAPQPEAKGKAGRKKKACAWCGRKSLYPCSDATDEQLRATYYAYRKGESDNICQETIPQHVKV